MKVLPRTYRQSRIHQAHSCDYEPAASILNYADVETFLNAKSEADHQELMHKYSSPFQPLYGTKEYFRDGSRRGIAFSNEYETANDFLNLKRLLEAGVNLCALLEKSDIIYQSIKHQDIGKLGIEVEEDAAMRDCLGVYYSMGIELEAAPETKGYLKKGLNNAMLSFPRCDLIECSDADGAAPKATLRICTGLIKPTPERLQNACASLLDALSTIMLHDLSVRVSNGAVFQLCESTTSSLWYTLLEAFREGRADFCEVCGVPFIALDERKNKRLYCSGACNKMHQRLEGYRRLVVEGLPEEVAAKKASVALSRAKTYWGSQLSTTDAGTQ